MCRGTPRSTCYDEPTPYREGFRSTAFDIQIERFPQSVFEVALLPIHGSTEILGRTRKLDRTDIGLHGVVQVLPSKRDDVAEMVDMGVDSVSIEFVPLQKRARDGEIRWRDRAMLKAVALTSIPAYTDAKVLAMRAGQIEHEAEALRAKQIEELDALLAEIRTDRWDHLR